MIRHWVGVFGLAWLGATGAGGAWAATLPATQEGLWEVRVQTTTKPANTRRTTLYKECRDHAVDQAAGELWSHVQGCTAQTDALGGDTYSVHTRCESRGTVITTRGAQIIQKETEQLDNPIMEMETAGIAGVVAEQGLPLLSLRAISDGPRAPIPFNLEAMMDEQDNIRIGEILKTMLGHPRILPSLVRMGRNTRKAADAAALALFAALSQPGPVIIGSVNYG